MQSSTKKVFNSRITIISGSAHQGKTTFAMKLVNALKKKNYRVGGFVAPGEFIQNQRSSFHITDLKTGITKPLCSREKGNGDKTGPFYFYEEGQQFGHQLLEPENLKDCNIVVIDEIGPFELQGMGWANSIRKLLACDNLIQLWVIRKNLVEEVATYFDVNNYHIIDIEHPTCDLEIKKLF
jgi:nucleoside-triphosphatase THEP1